MIDFNNPSEFGKAWAKLSENITDPHDIREAFAADQEAEDLQAIRQGTDDNQEKQEAA